MPSNFCFYIHHHGAGHLQRAVIIASALAPSSRVTFMGSDLHRYELMIPTRIRRVHLPMDTCADDDLHFRERRLSFVHYAPLNVAGISKRAQTIIDFFTQNPNTLFIIDVSVEVTLLARLCGIPTVVVRQHGCRTDLAHSLAYESAEWILAPYPAIMSTTEEEGLFATKTLFTGGFSRYAGHPYADCKGERTHVAVFIGRGGTPIDLNFVRFLKQQVPKFVLHVLGDIEEHPDVPDVHFYGIVSEPATILKDCSTVICNAGHNVIMELGDLRRRIICIPAARPFREQEIKAEWLRQLNLAVVVPESKMYLCDWQKQIDEAQRLQLSYWGQVMDPDAPAKISARLEHSYQKLYEVPPILEQ